MKIILNVEKKHLIFFGLFLVLVGGVFVIATSWTPYSSGKPYHEIMYSNIIGPVSGDVIEIKEASLKVPTHGKGIIFGEPVDQYRIHATSGNLNYGNEDTKNIFTGKICSSQNNCVSVSDLISQSGGEGNGGDEQPQITDLTFTTTNATLMLKKDGKLLYKDDSTARQFCAENSGSSDFEIMGNSINNCGNERVKKYAQTAWSEINCQDNVGYITSLKCKNVRTTTYQFIGGTGGLKVNTYYVAFEGNDQKFCEYKTHKKATSSSPLNGNSENCDDAGNDNKLVSYGYRSGNTFNPNDWHMMICNQQTDILDEVTCAG